MEIYITYLLQILSFSSRYRRFEMKNLLRQPTMVADNISRLVAPRQTSFHFYGPALRMFNNTFSDRYTVL